MDTNDHGGHTFHNTSIGADARVHMGNIYNLSKADSSQQRILAWLSTYNPSSSHDRACKQYQEGTLSWFFDDARFQNWRDTHNSGSPSVLWCRGNMGTGKTTLFAQVLCHLQARRNSRGKLAAVYCSFADRHNQTAEALLGSILGQLYLNDDQEFEIPRHVKTAFQQPWFWRRSPTMSQLQSWLEQSLVEETEEEPVFVLLDALDEMDSSSRRTLLRSLQSISCRSLRLLVTSRNLSDIGKELFRTQDIEVHVHANDLRTAILSQLRNQTSERFRELILNRRGRRRYATIEDEILAKVLATATDMFLVAKFHMDRISGCTRVDDVYAYLDTFPPELDTYYDQTWDRITSDRGSLTSNRARLILMWVTLAEEPLSVGALGDAISVSIHGVMKRRPTEEEIVGACAGLVHSKVNHVSHLPLAKDPWPKITFVHASAHQYFLNRASSYFPHAQDSIVATCLSVLDPGAVAWAVRFQTPYIVAILLPQIVAYLYSLNHVLQLPENRQCKSESMLLDDFEATTMALSLLGTVLFVGSTDFHFRGESSRYATKHLYRHAEKGRLTTKLRILKNVLRCRMVYFKLLFSWSSPAVLASNIISNHVSDEGKFSNNALESDLNAFRMRLIAFQLGPIAFLGLVASYGGELIADEVFLWDESVLIPCLLTSDILFWIVCQTAGISVVKLMAYGCVACAALLWWIFLWIKTL